MRQTYLVFFTFLVIIAALLITNLRISPNDNYAVREGIVLQSLPIEYCPKEAEIYRESKIGKSNILAVINCDTISLTNMKLIDGEKIIVKLPKALAFKINYNDGASRYLIGLRVGDVTQDNIIDDQDRRFVSNNLFSSNTKADVDMDGSVTVHDLSLTIINKAVGALRPDNKEWRL